MSMLSEQQYKLVLQRKRENRLASFQRKLERLKTSPEYVKRDCLKEIRLSNQKLNCVRFNLGDTEHSHRHEIVKAYVCLELAKLGHEYISEAIFLNGKRGDVIDLNEAIIYEITYSETEEELKEKVKDYPPIFEIRQIDSKLRFKTEMMF